MTKTIFLCAGILSVFFCKGQNGPNPALPKIIPTSPEVASLGKYGDIPVGYQTGTANISIPITSLKQNDININVSASYHTGGNKVEEIASSIGMGWSLSSGGGTISRSQRGLPDEDVYYGYFKNVGKANQYFDGQMVGQQATDYIKNISCGYMDGEADIFHLSIDGFSGKFFMGSDSAFHTMPKSNLKISYSNNQWTIINEKGNKFFFGIYETTFVEPYCNGNNNGMTSSINAWHLTKLTDKANDTITFSYYYEMTQRVMIGTDEYSLVVGGGSCTPGPAERTFCTNHVQTHSYKIAQIKTKTGRIVFIPQAAQRLDYTGSYAIKYVALLNNANDTIKKTQFHTSYFAGNRLRLDSCYDIKGDKITSRYVFNYNNSIVFPDVLSFSQDYWGFYNGANNNTLAQYQNSLTGPEIGADRKTNGTNAKVGILESIVYPTGGKTTFEYESNVYSKQRTPGLDFEVMTSYFSLSGSNATPSANPAITTSSFNVSSGDIIQSLGYNVVQANLQYLCSNPSLFNSFTLSIVGNNGFSDYSVYDGDILNLPVGTYTVTASIETEFANTPDCSFNLSLLKVKWDPRDRKNYAGGGLRVKEIKTYTNQSVLPDMVRQFSYNIPGDTISSGQLSGMLPKIDPYLQRSCSGPQDPSDCCDKKIFNASSTYPLLETSGKPIAYEYVATNEAGSNSNGSKLMRFNTYSEFPDAVYIGYPYIPAEDKNWRRGNLKFEKINKQSASTGLEVIQETRKGYYEFSDYTTDPALSVSKNVKVAKNVVIPNYDCDYVTGLLLQTLGQEYGIHIGAYRNITEPFAPKTDTTVTYSGGTVLQSIRMLGLNTNNFLTYVDSVKNSKGEILITKNKFPKDYSFTQNTHFVAKLVEANQVIEPIESLVLVSKNGEDFVKGGTITTYNSSTLLPDTVFSLTNNSLIPLASFVHSSINASGQFIKDSRYEAKIVFTKYDAARNVLEVKKDKDYTISYLYGYYSSYPVAEIKGADYETAAALVNPAILNNPSNAQTLRTELNNIRTGLANTSAQVNTYTYEPLVGVTSTTDANGNTTYYEYDIFNRLILIKDNYGKILKKLCYNLYNQETDCTVPCTEFTPNWQNTNNLRCQTDSYGENTGYQEQEQQDINNCSPTSNQTRWILAGQNTTACPLPVYISLTSTNTYNTTGYVASYYNTATGHTYTFNVSSTAGLQSLGTVPAGNYTLSITRPSGPISTIFRSGCFKQVITGNSATFYNVAVSTTTCNSITVTINAAE